MAGNHGIDLNQNSRFCYKDLKKLERAERKSPLRVIAFLGLDCFFSQCESRRRGDTDEVPLAVENFGKVLCFNYAARAAGVNHETSAADIKSRFKKVKLQHVPLWRLDEKSWKYRQPPDPPSYETDKASFESYRSQFRAVVDIVRAIQRGQECKIEKLHFTKIFLDLSTQVHKVLVQRFPALGELNGDVQLPRSCANYRLDWEDAEMLGSEPNGDQRMADTDWDVVALNVGAEIMRGIRKEIFQQLQYTCSVGIGHNKIMAKAAYLHEKDSRGDRFSVITRQRTESYLSTLKLFQIHGYSDKSKVGRQVKSVFGTDTISDLSLITLDVIKKQLDRVVIENNQTTLNFNQKKEQMSLGTRLYRKIRGEDEEDVRNTPDEQHISSEKKIQIDKVEQSLQWLRLLTAEIFERLRSDPSRRPKVLSVVVNPDPTDGESAMQPESRKIGSQVELSHEYLFQQANTIMANIRRKGDGLPWHGLRVKVSGFFDVRSPNKIDEMFKAQRSVASRQPAAAAATAVVTTRANFNKAPDSMPYQSIASSSKRPFIEISSDDETTPPKAAAATASRDRPDIQAEDDNEEDDDANSDRSHTIGPPTQSSAETISERRSRTSKGKGKGKGKGKKRRKFTR